MNKGWNSNKQQQEQQTTEKQATLKLNSISFNSVEHYVESDDGVTPFLCNKKHRKRSEKKWEFQHK